MIFVICWRSSGERMLEYLEPDWPAPPGVHAISSCRGNTGSSGPYRGLNLAQHVGDDPEQVEKNRDLLYREAGLPAKPCWLQQVHGHRVVAASESGSDAPLQEADAIETDSPGLVCAVMTADCLPVLFASMDGRWVAAAHAGWRGLASGVLRAPLARAPADSEVMAWLGPAIGPDAFEVGDEVRQILAGLHPAAAQAFRAGRSGRWWADIGQLARLQLLEAGVSRIYGGRYCTWTDARCFYSYRRDGVTGRMASLIWRN